MEETATRLREAILALGRTKRNTPVPAPLRAEVMAFVTEQRRAGARWASLAQAVGLSASGLKRWSQCEAPSPGWGLRPVFVREERGGSAHRGLVLVLSQGHRLEGLSREDALVMLGALAAKG